MTKNINAIILHLDSYLTRTAQASIGPIEGNDTLAKIGILADNKERPGKPLRDLLRKGLIPHAFQNVGTGSKWTIPHSRNTISTLDLNVQGNAKKSDMVPEMKTLLSEDEVSVEQVLIQKENFKSAGIIDQLVLPKPGLYCIRINNIAFLPETFRNHLEKRQHNILYIGIASKNLRARLVNQELRAIGHGSFFRSIGAILGFRPPSGSLCGKANKRNYRFTVTDQSKIISWINDNLSVNWVYYSSEFEVLESLLIKKVSPLINLLKNPYRLKELSKLRTFCVTIANHKKAKNITEFD